MTVRTVLRMGEPLLLKRAHEITNFDTPELHTLIQDMEDTMADMHGAGLAAPQIGVSLRLVIFGKKMVMRQRMYVIQMLMTYPIQFYLIQS